MLYRILPLCIKRTFATKLVEVGRLQQKNLVEAYKPGQMFMHRLLAYRGVILFAWHAHVYDRDMHVVETIESGTTETEPKLKKDSAQCIYYNALIDSRDAPFVRSKAQGVSFLANSDSSGEPLYSIPGLDYVSHEDVLPYSPSEKTPLKHELMGQFLVHQPGRDPPFKSHRTLVRWHNRNRRFLEVCDVHAQTTRDIRVTVIPFFMGCQDSLAGPRTYWWRFWILLENLGALSVQLRERNWRVFNADGGLVIEKVRGVLGEEPTLSPASPAFRYSSHVSLETSQGEVWGTLLMEREDGLLFDCKIPHISLRSTKLNCVSDSE